MSMRGVTRAKLRLKENNVEDQILDYLRYRGWEPVRLQAGTLRGKNGSYVRLGVRGRADWLMLRPAETGTCEAFYLETKRPGGKRSAAQIGWAETQTHLGFLVTHADCIEDFERWYGTNYGERR